MMPNKKWQMQIREAVVPSGDLRGMIDHDRQRCALGINRGQGCYLARLDDRGSDWNILHAVARHHDCLMRRCTANAIHTTLDLFFRERGTFVRFYVRPKREAGGRRKDRHLLEIAAHGRQKTRKRSGERKELERSERELRGRDEPYAGFVACHTLARGYLLRQPALRAVGDGINGNEIQYFWVTGQAEQRLRKCTGGDLGQRRDASAPMPVANSKQCRPMTPRDRHFRSSGFGVMV